MEVFSNGKRATPRKCPARRFVCRWGSLSSLLVQLNSVTWPARSAGNEKDRSRRTLLGGAFPLPGGDLTFERERRRCTRSCISDPVTGYRFLSYRTGGGRECYVKRTNDDERGVGVGWNRMIDYEIDNETKPRGEST